MVFEIENQERLLITYRINYRLCAVRFIYKLENRQYYKNAHNL